jgi:hypothetical protein
MYEKGFMIDVIGCSRQVFLQQQWKQKEMTSALQDGNQE